MKQFKRITVDPKQMGGAPCIRGLRIPVTTVAGMVSEGMTGAQILKAYPGLELADIREALRYAVENIFPDLTEQQLDGIRQQVLSGPKALETGKFREYEGREGLKKLADKVKKAGRFRTKSRRDGRS